MKSLVLFITGVALVMCDSNLHAELITPVTAEYLTGVTNRQKFGYSNNCTNCPGQIKMFKKRTVSEDLTATWADDYWDYNGYVTYQTVDKYEMTAPNLETITYESGTFSYYTSGWEEGMYPCTYERESNGEWPTEAPPCYFTVYAPGIPVVSSDIDLTYCIYNREYHSYEYGMDDSGYGTSSTIYSSEYTTSELVGVDPPYQTEWSGSGSAFLNLKEEETSAYYGKMKYRFKFIAEKDKPFEFAYVKHFRGDETNYSVDLTASGTGTGTWQYYPEGDPEEVSVPKFASSDSCRTYQNFEIAVEVGCSGSGGGCSADCGTTPGTGVFRNGSVDVALNLGAGDFGRGSGALHLYSEIPNLSLSTPAMLNYFGSFENVDVISTNGSLQQVKAPQCLADVVVINTNKYEVKFYSSSGTKDSSGLYLSPSGLFSTATIEHVSGSTNHLRVTIDNGTESVSDYEWSDADQGWTLTTGGGLRKETKTWNGSLLVATNTIKNANDSIAFQKVTYFQNLTNYGLVATQEVIAPSQAALTTQWFYYDNLSADGTNYGKLKMLIEPSGKWTRYEYTTNRMVQKEISQFLNAPTNALESESRVREYDYTLIGSANDSKCVVEKLLGTEISRHYDLKFSYETRDIHCSTPGAAWDASDNLVTVTKFYNDGDVRSAAYPNGTLELYEYETNGTQVVTTTYRGEPGPGGASVISGTKTVVTVGELGEVISTTTKDIASEITISKTDYYDFNFGRAQTTVHFDSIYEYANYGCCGLESTTGVDGTYSTYTYDPLKRLSTTTRDGITVSNVYDAVGNILSMIRIGTDSSAVVAKTSTFDFAGRLVTSADAMNNSSTNRYGVDGSGQTVITNFAANGGTRIQTHAKDGSLMEISGTAAFPLRYRYGIESESGTNRYFMQEMRLIGSSTNDWKKGFSDMQGRTYKTVYPDASHTHSVYNGMGQLFKNVDQDGVVTLYGYNSRGELEDSAVDINRNDEIDLDGTDRITRMVRDVVHNHDVDVIRKRTFVWMDNGSDSSLCILTNEVSVNGLKRWQITSAGTSSSEMVYNGSGSRTATQFEPDNSFTVNQYQNGRLTSTTKYDSNSVQIAGITYDYDPHRRQSEMTDARTGTTTYTFNNADQITSVTTPIPEIGESSQVTSNLYNNMGKVWKTVQPDGTTVTNEYYFMGLLKKTYGSRTYPVEYTYDDQGRMKTMKTWQNFATSAGSATTTWNYDAQRGFMVNKRYADNQGPNYTNSPAGRLQARLWARGILTTYGYNYAGDLETTSYSDATPSVTFTYDRKGRRKTAVQGGMTNVWEYNEPNEILSETFSGGILDGLSVTNGFDGLMRRTALGVSGYAGTVTRFGYDAASRLQAVTNGNYSAVYSYLANSPLTETVEFYQGTTNRMTTTKGYDNLNRLKSIVNETGAGVASSHEYVYNDANQRTRATLENGSYWVYQYDSLGQVTSGKKYWSDGTVVAGQQFEYGFDDIGNRKTAASGGDQWGANLQYENYTVNTLNQYSQRTVPGVKGVIGTAHSNATVTVNNQGTYRKGEYFYKALPLDNWAAPVYASLTNLAVLNNGTNADIVTNIVGHALLPRTPEVFTYDADGNLTSDGIWTNRWDAENRLREVETLSAVPTGAKKKLVFSYDHQGRRISKTVSNWVSSAWSLGESKRFVYDDWNLLAVFNGSTLLHSFVWGSDLSGTMQGAGGVGGLLAFNDTTNVHFAAFDGNGNVATLVNGANGTVSANYEYGPFNESIRVTGEMAKINPFRFSTKYTDDETDWVYYGYRYLREGRWINRDPINELGFDLLIQSQEAFNLNEEKNLYNFVGNNSILYYDARGLLIQIPLSIGNVLGDIWQRILKGTLTGFKCLRAVTCSTCAGGLLGMEAICIGWESQGYSSFNDCVCVNYNESKLLQVMCRGCLSPVSVFGDPVKAALGCK